MMKNLRRFFLGLTLASALAGFVVALLDGLVAAAGSSASLGSWGVLRMSLSLAALAVIPAALLGIVEAVLLGGLAGIQAREFWRRVRDDAAKDRRTAAWIMAGALAAGAFALALARISPALFALPEDAPARAGALALRGLVLGSIALVLLGAAALAAWTLARALSAQLERVPERWRARVPFTLAAFALCAMAALAGGLAVLLPRSELFLSWDGSLVLWAVLFVALQIAFAVAWARRPRRRAWVLGAGALSVALLGGSVAAIFTYDDPALLTVTFQRTAVGKRAVTLWRWALDFDGDGYSALLGGGDCDDGNPNIHPGAYDIPGNGVDEDCSGSDAPLPTPAVRVAERRRTGTNLLLITVDTLRPDHLGAYGYERATSPRIDAFARTAVVFERAFAAANHTPRSIPALLSGQYPSRLPWKKLTNYPPLADNARTIADDLRAAGYRTAGVFPHWYFHKRRNLHRGFDIWDLSTVPVDDDGSATTAPEVTQRAKQHLRKLAKGPAPFFLWVHYYEPHYPYVDHEGSPRFGGKMIDRYDGEIRFTDEHVGELLTELEAVGAAGQTAVVVTSDHGEAFGEHKKHWHGHALYDEQVRVPLLVRAPGVAAARVKGPVSAVDVVPTLLEIAGLPARGELAGRSLVPVARGAAAAADRPVFVELLAYPNFPRTMRAVVVGDWKLIHDISENRYELYDIAQDPREEQDLSLERPAEAERLKAILAKFADGSPLAALDRPR
jgi:arylsulfatase A-like enzyme